MQHLRETLVTSYECHPWGCPRPRAARLVEKVLVGATSSDVLGVASMGSPFGLSAWPSRRGRARLNPRCFGRFLMERHQLNGPYRLSCGATPHTAAARVADCPANSRRKMEVIPASRSGQHHHMRPSSSVVMPDAIWTLRHGCR